MVEAKYISDIAVCNVYCHIALTQRKFRHVMSIIAKRISDDLPSTPLYVTVTTQHPFTSLVFQDNLGKRHQKYNTILDYNEDDDDRVWE